MSTYETELEAAKKRIKQLESRLQQIEGISDHVLGVCVNL